ncbi:uncharacterized protein BDR25DRAFT_393469 [Lindgomyces ingoldianus]|uniref:Uncharacterized protein n=1 Tax=Lindgomyces ingoldianus TaxID=673940 RepID=A0ACB6QZ30_9PLEO|nr:uncharacterized protein BDR25DRAFT_393469 [Lindgomyces ingoldianus]KAF2471352.1 hypothetical protein BDR25DRAFT_393469 [Lindgomyces ingoldianus]
MLDKLTRTGIPKKRHSLIRYLTLVRSATPPFVKGVQLLTHLRRCLWYHQDALALLPYCLPFLYSSNSSNFPTSNSLTFQSRYSRVISTSPDLIPNNIKDKSQHAAEATQLSDNDYGELVELYFEAVVQYSEIAQEEGSTIAVEFAVRSYLQYLRKTYLLIQN